MIGLVEKSPIMGGVELKEETKLASEQTDGLVAVLLSPNYLPSCYWDVWEMVPHSPSMCARYRECLWHCTRPRLDMTDSMGKRTFLGILPSSRGVVSTAAWDGCFGESGVGDDDRVPTYLLRRR